MRIVQIVPYIGAGTGVAGVAWNLENEFRALGHTVESFTMDVARTRPRRPWPRRVFFRALALFRQMVWFSTVGTVRARRFLAARPDAVSICHNAIMAGDVYVNHGVVGAAMRARGRGTWRMLRNPTHAFTFVRDLIRYRSNIHRAVVALSTSEVETLNRVYGQVRPPVTVIPNGVDLDRYHPPTQKERTHARARFRLNDEDRVALFVGHEFDRKGLDVAISALTHAPTVLLLVAGGNIQAIDKARGQAESLGVSDRVMFMGPRSDLPLFFAASDLFVLPSAYEANALVVLEALAAGLPVIATRVGYAPEVIVDGLNGYLVDRDAAQLGDRFEQIAAAGRDAFASQARASAEAHGWKATAERYIALLEPIAAARGGHSVSAPGAPS
ncbi:glycosyltransferase family 4 protein [Rathayibacter soli]|uniref:glycosyltransferase family 4 protein n=1 Tax=Rathayibacter soli TaxID=3144168 RepID=UPI0027E44047|nr:glycosyltransferase family 4 protein [Glaciibacter superstes]